MKIPERMIDSHTHMKAWTKAARRFVEKSGIAQFWVMNSGRKGRANDDEIIKASKDMPGKIIPFAHIEWNVWAKDPKEVDRTFEKGAVGLKAIRSPLPYNHDSYFPIYERANCLSMPILFHTGIIAHAIFKRDFLGKRSFGPTNMEPAMLAGIASAFPELPVIGGHLGYPYTEQTHHNLYYYPNICHDICGYVPWEWLLANLSATTCHYLKGPRFYSEKILHATDCNLGDENSQKWAAEKYVFWPYFLQVVGRRYPWGKHKNKILFENAERIMKSVLKKQKKNR